MTDQTPIEEEFFVDEGKCHRGSMETPKEGLQISEHTPKVEPWMEDVQMDDPHASQPCMGPRLHIPVDAETIAEAYEPTAKRVQALVDALEFAAVEICEMICQSGLARAEDNPFHCQGCVNTQHALADYRKGGANE